MKNKLTKVIITLLLFMCYMLYNEYKNDIYAFIYKDNTNYIEKENVGSYNSDKIPEYNGKSYIILNNNEPNFNDEDFLTDTFEKYSPLDKLGRCGVAFANISIDLMPTIERGSIGMIKPSGWHTVKYDIVSGKYLYNRCHLIGYQLTGENANEKNLITCTRSMNMGVMLDYENKVANYVESTGNHVLYRATPIFEGDNLLAGGVQLEAYSVEDKGDGICFNVFIFNVQPGVKIDYLTGESSLEDESTAPTPTPKPSVTPKPTPKPSPSSTAQAQSYVLNTKTHVFHYASCRHVSSIKDANRKNFTGSRDALISDGFKPCGSCHP